MKTLCLLLILLSSTIKYGAPQDYGKPVEEPMAILKNFDSFLSYYGTNVKLEANFMPFDESSHQITKDAFLRSVVTGKYLPLRLQSKLPYPVYRLYKLDASVNSRVAECLHGWAADYYGRYSKLGKPFPKFNFVDMNGKVYNNENTRGKILVLKGWDLTCPPCIREIPELNNMVKKYQNRKDIVFLSLVPDDDAKVKEFLVKHPFSYPVVTHQHFLYNNLQFEFAPCHIIVNKEGIITCATFMTSELENDLAKEAKD